jgi:uncharacterized protein
MHHHLMPPVCLLFAGLLPVTVLADSIMDGQTPVRITPVAPPKARPFNLHDVRLLEGPFKTGQNIGAKYLMSLEPDRLLANFRKEAGLAPKADHYTGWESKGVSGHSLGHYLSACSMGWAATGDKPFLDRANYIVDELAECQAAQGDGYVAAIPGGKKAYAEVATGEIRSAGFDLNGIWVPNYTMHKVLAGLRDAYRLCGNQKALDVSKGLADWFEKTLSGLSEEQMQKVLAAEHGGMNEVLADLYADTGDARYLALSRRFHHKIILDPLALGEDILPGKHANTQIPKIIGLATRYELTGDLSDRAAAQFFWDRVVHHHTYVTGGNCQAEHFGPPDQLNGRLLSSTTETCNVYNMLKLTEHVFGWNPNADAADFYERALLNHIRGSQHPDGRVIYNVSLKPGFHKEYQKLADGFTCCMGTGMENHVKYGEGIYFHDDASVWVNLFIASDVNWKSHGVNLRQETSWPDGDHSTITITCAQSKDFTLRIRHPFWADTLTVKVNGELVSDSTSPSSYCQIKRTWKSSDKVEITFPMAIRTEAMPDNPDRIAVFHGPTLLAADLGAVTDPEADQPGFVPVLLTDGRPVTDWVKPVSLAEGKFKTVDAGKPHEVELVPFHRLHDRRYTVYFDRFTADDWAKRQAEIQVEEQRARDLESRTVDVFNPGEMQPERDHNLQGRKSTPGEALGRKFRHAVDGGWFSYEMKVESTKSNELVCTWWGNETGTRQFDILVDGTKIATQNLSNKKTGKFWDATYPIPPELTQGKMKITVRLQAQPGNIVGGLFGSRILKKP